MKERLLTWLAVAALLFTIQLPILTPANTSVARGGPAPTTECHGGNVCGG